MKSVTNFVQSLGNSLFPSHCQERALCVLIKAKQRQENEGRGRLREEIQGWEERSLTIIMAAATDNSAEIDLYADNFEEEFPGVSH